MRIRFWEKEVTGEWVDLTIGRVHIRPRTRKMFNKAVSESLSSKGYDPNKLLASMEEQAVILSKKKMDGLGIKDTNALRDKIIALLKEEGIINDEKTLETDEPNIFGERDVEWFAEQKDKWLKKPVMVGGDPRGNRR